MPTPAKPAASDAALDPMPAAATVAVSSPASSGPTLLDGSLVIGGLAIIGAVLGLLFFVKVPQENLPIVSGLAGTLLGTVIGGYAAYRWGASDAMKRLTAQATTNS